MSNPILLTVLLTYYQFAAKEVISLNLISEDSTIGCQKKLPKIYLSKIRNYEQKRKSQFKQFVVKMINWSLNNNKSPQF